MSGSDIPVTVGRALKEGGRYLARQGVVFPETACELLVARLLACGRMDLLLRRETVLTERHAEALRRGLRRVAAGEPVQYVLGQWDFRALTLRTDARALIPRPETEQLIDRVLASPVWSDCASPQVVDVGTGSGCIVLSLAHERPAGVFVGIDRSPEALSLARENAVACGLAERVAFREGCGCAEFLPGSIDLIVSNPPYIASAVVDGLERHIRDHEPRMALDGGVDGLDVLRAIVRDAVMVLRPGGWIYFEIGDDQGSSMRRLLEEAGFADVCIARDLAGKIRFAEGRLAV